MAENEECKICLVTKADNIPILNIITIDEYHNLTGIRLGPLKVKKIYVCKKCARDIKEAREIHNKIITSLEERKTRALAECGNICALNSEPITDISRHKQSELIANFLRRELESDEQGIVFVCQKCFVKIDHANKTCKKIIESLKDFVAAKTPQKSAIKSEATGNTPSPKTPKQKELTNGTKNNDLPTTGTTPKTSKPKKATNVSVKNKSSPTTTTRKISNNDNISLEEMEVILKVKTLNIKK